MSVVLKCDAELCGETVLPQDLHGGGWITVTEHGLDGLCVDLHYCSQSCLVRDHTAVTS